MQFWHSEYPTIAEVTGTKITLTEPLKYYHFGTGKSTGNDYNGVDMRGEVILLSRNI